MSRRHFTRGNSDTAKPNMVARIAGAGTGVQLEGFRECPYCDKKNLNATEMSIRSHLRVHVRDGKLPAADIVKVYKDILFRRESQ